MKFFILFIRSSCPSCPWSIQRSIKAGRVFAVRFFILFCLALASCNSEHPHRLAICAMFKNEARWMKEWLDYHSEVLGVQKFYLYNDQSADSYLDVLAPYIEKGTVELIDWDSSDPAHQAHGSFMDAPWSAGQLGAYNDCLKNRALTQAAWVAMIDIDEFIVPQTTVSDFYGLLKKAEKKKIGTLRLFWRVFGTSQVQDLAEGESLLKNLTWRSRDDHPWNRHVKSIHRPEAVAFCMVHEADKLYPKYRRKTVSLEKAAIHHYWTRTERFCAEKRSMSQATHPEFFEALHQIQDEKAGEFK